MVNGNSFSDETIYLDSDIDFSSFSGQFAPIGSYVNDRHFNGTFDGQGHTISNLKIFSSSDDVGLFEYSFGPTTIRNLVMDSSCSITSNHTSTSYYNPCVGSVIGYCGSYYGPCIIESIVNMANVSFVGNVTHNSAFLYVGGIAGVITYMYTGDAVVRNCINYGIASITGIASLQTNFGGIVGWSWGRSKAIHSLIQNCLNYGTLIFNGTTPSISLGGISGNNYVTSIENCVSAGELVMMSHVNNNSTGSICGFSDSYGKVNHCYWTSDVGDVNNSFGRGKFTIEDTALTEVNTTTVEELNEYAQNNNWNNWLLNINGASVTFVIDNDSKDLTVSSQLILFPDLGGDDENKFSGWHKDSTLFDLFNEYEVTRDIKFYSTYGSLSIVTFNPNCDNVSLSSSTKVVKFNVKYGTLPVAERTGYTLVGWFTNDTEGEGDKIESDSVVTISSNHTLYAQWTINQYTVTFDFGNGSTPYELTLNYNAPVEYPVNIVKEGYKFNGWDINITNMPANNITITAQWEEDDETFTSQYVKISFSSKDLSEEEVKKIISSYTSSEFNIAKFEDNDGGVTVIIKFDDTEEATRFVRTIKDSSNEFVNEVDMIIYDDLSSSFRLHPFLFIFQF